MWIPGEKTSLVLHRGSCIGVVLCRHERVAGREEAVVATLPPLEVSDEDRAVLGRWLRAHTTEQRMRLRARAVLPAPDRHPNRAIAAATGLSEEALSRWRRRYGRAGLNG